LPFVKTIFASCDNALHKFQVSLSEKPIWFFTIQISLVLTEFIRSRERILYKGGNKYDFEDSGFIFSLDF